jgi:hypothetical protein
MPTIVTAAARQVKAALPALVDGREQRLAQLNQALDLVRFGGITLGLVTVA